MKSEKVTGEGKMEPKIIKDDIELKIIIDANTNTYVCRWRYDAGEDIGPYIQEQGLAIVLGWGMEVEY